MLDEFGRPARDRYERYARLKEQKEALRTALSDESPDHGTTDVEAILDEALSGP